MSKAAPSAASALLGMTLSGGWKVTEKLSRLPNATGGTFSHGYIAQRDGQKAFLKAFDFSTAFEPSKNTIEILQALTNAYANERDILEHCKSKRMGNVVLALDSGDVQVPGMNQMEGRVFYLIFELAEGDVRKQVDTAMKRELVWTMRALKDVALCLWQVHREQIAHQDPKPSNVLLCTDKRFRVADFGRSCWNGRGYPLWYENERVAGDRTYAPPELLYGFLDPNFAVRRIGCDLYMFGNLVAFMFGGVNMTANLLGKLDPQFHHSNWKGKYSEVLAYVQEAFTRALEELEIEIDPVVRVEVLQVVRQLCNPDVARRGHPRGLGRNSQYSLERYVSLFERLSREVDVRLRLAQKAD